MRCLLFTAAICLGLAGCSETEMQWNWGEWNTPRLQSQPIASQHAGQDTDPPLPSDAQPVSSPQQRDHLDPIDDQVNAYAKRLASSQQMQAAQTATDNEPSPNTAHAAPPRQPRKPQPFRTTEVQAASVLPPDEPAAQASHAAPLGPTPTQTAPQPLTPVTRESSGNHASSPPSPTNAAGLADSDEEQPLSIELIAIKPAEDRADATPVNSTIAANQPAEHPEKDQPANLTDLLSQFEASVDQAPPNIEDQLKLRLLRLANDQDEAATGPIDGFDPIQTELMSTLIRTIATTRQAIRRPPEATPDALITAKELCRLLGQQSGIIIPKVAMVTRVDSFGAYEAISPLRFAAGQPIHAYLYAEVANFRCEPVDEGRLHTLMSETVEVFDPTGKSIWKQTQPRIEDFFRSPRHDFFIGFPVHLPAEMPVGDYVLKVTIEDQIGGTVDQQRLSFSVVRQ